MINAEHSFMWTQQYVNDECCYSLIYSYEGKQDRNEGNDLTEPSAPTTPHGNKPSSPLLAKKMLTYLTKPKTRMKL